LLFGTAETMIEHNRRVAQRQGAILPLVSLSAERLGAGEDYDVGRLLDERAISTNTAAAGGNAALLLVASD
jgi:RHH-type proline utilization regulon transcriptional repressor/proline dehydrogenase/delta 1-pyrroline-5-carboxylate dehydrogenase